MNSPGDVSSKKDERFCHVPHGHDKRLGCRGDKACHHLTIKVDTSCHIFWLFFSRCAPSFFYPSTPTFLLVNVIVCVPVCIIVCGIVSVCIRVFSGMVIVNSISLIIPCVTVYVIVYC